MMQCKKGPFLWSHILTVLSALAAVLAGVVFFGGMDQLWNLAGTQWILIAIALGVYAVNLHQCGATCAQDDDDTCCGDACQCEGDVAQPKS